MRVPLVSMPMPMGVPWSSWALSPSCRLPRGAPLGTGGPAGARRMIGGERAKNAVDCRAVERGWTPIIATRLLGEPDAIGPNPHYRNAAPMRLYALSRVEAAEASSAFAAARAGSAARSAGARKAAPVKREALLREVSAMQVTVKLMPADRVQRLAIADYNSTAFERGKDPVSADAPRSFLERITVNYIRHQLTRYDGALEETDGRVGVREAACMIRRKVFDAIAANYPALADECRWQMEQRKASRASAARGDLPGEAETPPRA